MTTTRETYYRSLYWVAAAYDIVLGVTFLFFYDQIARALEFEAELPEYGGYASLIAAFVFVIGIGYVFVARGDLVRNIDLIAVGTIYKLAYTLVAVYYLARDDYPHAIFVGFGVADFVFLVLMAECWWFVRRLDIRWGTTQPDTG